MAKVTLNAVGKQWGNVTALQPTDLEITDGEFIAILGPSGCGKSTLLFMLAGIYMPTEGEILFDDQRINEVEAKDRNVGIVFQSYALYPHMNVQKNIMFPLKFKKIPPKTAKQKVENVAKLVHVDEFLDRRPSQLSGGQQQRVALARALVKEPHLLLLDEPLSNLDATLRLTMRTEIRALQKRLGLTTILVTHDQLEAITMADRIVCMSRGKIEQIGSADELYHHPNSLFVAKFIGSPPINIITGKAEKNEVTIDETILPITQPYTGDISIGIRPESIRLTGCNHSLLSGKIIRIEPMGREYLVAVDTSVGAFNVLCQGTTIEYSIDEHVGLHADPNNWLVFAADGSRIENLHIARVNKVDL